MQNFVKKHELLSAVVAVNHKYIDADGLQPTHLPTPESTLLTKAIEEGVAETLTWLEDSVLEDFVEKGRINSIEAKNLKAGVEQYLCDLAHTGETDSLPEYFRGVMLENTHDKYLSDYKYVFETVINKAVEDFKRRLKKKTTVLKYRDYFKNG